MNIVEMILFILGGYLAGIGTPFAVGYVVMRNPKAMQIIMGRVMGAMMRSMAGRADR